MRGNFADQLENKIIPALRAGYIVSLTDIYYTLMARDAVRGISKSWSHNLYGFVSLKPDLLFYLDVDRNELAHRVFKKNSSLDYYESGVDLGLSEKKDVGVNDVVEALPADRANGSST